MSAKGSSKFENMKYTGPHGMPPITEHADNELNFEVTIVSVESMKMIESQMHDGMDEDGSQ